MCAIDLISMRACKQRAIGFGVWVRATCNCFLFWCVRAIGFSFSACVQLGLMRACVQRAIDFGVCVHWFWVWCMSAIAFSFDVCVQLVSISVRACNWF